MINRLSHSAATKFQDCPTAYNYHYNERLRSTVSHAALLFGSAVDAATTSMMLSLKGDKQEHTPEQIFDRMWNFQEVNGVLTSLATCTTIVYSNSDFDADLLDDLDWKQLGTVRNERLTEQESKERLNRIYSDKEYSGFNHLPEEDKEVLNYANWLCLFQKGRLMLQAVREQVIPNITEVLGAQELVELKNAEGDSIIGYADLICRWKGSKEPIVFDYKTSARMYEEDSVLTSPQLTLYVHALSEKFDNTRKAGYIVLHKLIRKNKTKTCKTCNKDGSGKRHKTCDEVFEGKRCNGEWDEQIDPKVFVQVIVSEIPERTEEIVLQNFDYINNSIKNGIFHRNLGNCVKPYGKCNFYNLCFYNKDDGLMKLEKKDESR